MRHIDKIIVHCSATPADRDVDVKDIDRWHREKGWEGCGYHYVIKRDGTIQWGRPIEKMGAHCQGQNSASIGICLVGGIDNEGNPQDNFTTQQRSSLSYLLMALKRFVPQALLFGHNEFAHKACPVLDLAPFKELWDSARKPADVLP